MVPVQAASQTPDTVPITSPIELCWLNPVCACVCGVSMCMWCVCGGMCVSCAYALICVCVVCVVCAWCDGVSVSVCVLVHVSMNQCP